ncbi:DUF11 domain-containing protein, partial [Thiolinea disciformis]|uniref:DUF11 domain-containing protein n=1 Tax=Thiolinea disciformis TaxID=125614 RepID=UPI00037712DC
VQTHTDLTTTAAGTTQSPVDGAGKLQLNKSVWNVTRNSAGEVAKPGETLRYTIAYENIGNGTLNTLVIHDRVPEFTDLVTGSLQCNDTPPEISSCTPTATGDTLMWNFSGNLPAGQYGEVYYDTLIK